MVLNIVGIKHFHNLLDNMEEIRINITDETPIAAIPFGLLKDTMLQMFSSYIEEYLKRKEEDTKGRKVEGLFNILAVLRWSKDKFYEEKKKGNLDDVLHQFSDGCHYVAYEEELLRKKAELSARNKKKQ